LLLRVFNVRLRAGMAKRLIERQLFYRFDHPINDQTCCHQWKKIKLLSKAQKQTINCQMMQSAVWSRRFFRHMDSIKNGNPWHSYAV